MIEIPEINFHRLVIAAHLSHRRGGIAGQTFTNYTCLGCNKDRSNPDTNTPRVCSDCVKEAREFLEPKNHVEVCD